MASHCLTSHAGSAFPARSPASVRLGEMSLSSGPGARAELGVGAQQDRVQLEGEPAGPSASIRIGQAGAVPFQPRFRPVSVRPPTVPVSPVPGTARTFPRRGDNLCHVSGGAGRRSHGTGDGRRRAARHRGRRRPGPRGHPGRGAHDDKLPRPIPPPTPGGSSPKLICGDFCDPQPGPGVPATITCTITADTPYYDAPADYLIFTADTTCTGNVGQISMTQNVIHPGVNLTDSHVINNYYIAVTNDTTLCSPGQWAVSASARFPFRRDGS